MTRLLPKNINWTIANWKLVKKLDDNTFAEATSADITALGFSPAGSSWWPVDGLDWICSISWQWTAYRANYRWETQWTRASAGEWSWYDNVTKKVFVSSTNNVSVYDLNWTLLNTITTVWSGDILKWSNATRLLFTKNWCQRINMDTMVVTNGIWGTFLDISPDGTTWISLTDNQFLNTGSFTITTFNTATMSVINTYTYTNTTYPSNNVFVWATLISNTEFVVYYADWANWNRTWAFRRILISTNATVNNITYAWVNDDWYSIQYSPSDNKIYSTRFTNTWSSVFPMVYSMNIDLTSYSWIISAWWFQESPILYRTSDNSIWCWNLELSNGWYFQKIIKRWSFSKKRDTFSLPVSNGVSQISIIY